MTPSDPPQPPAAGEPPDRAHADVGPLLTRANLFRARGHLDQAIAACQEALQRDPDSWEAHELMGDLYRQTRKGEEAMQEYRIALARNPRRGVIEEKIARASLIASERRRLIESAEALLAGDADRSEVRNPSIAGLFSFVIPGLGQLYNHDYAKGFVVLFVWLVLAIRLALTVLSSAGRGGGQGGLMDLLSQFFSGGALVLVILLVILWIYAVVDAALRAGKTMVGPQDIV